LAPEGIIRVQGTGMPIELDSLRGGDHATGTDVRAGQAHAIDVVLQPDRRFWALIIAYQEYDDNRLTKLQRTTNDTDALRETLIAHYRIAPEQLLLERGASRRTLEQGIPRFLNRIPAGSQLLVYFAGHAYVIDKKLATLAPIEFDLNRPDVTGVPLAWLIQELDRCPAEEKILLFDACHDGAGADRQLQPASAEIIRILSPDGKRIAKSTHIVASCDAQQRDLPAPNGEHSLFAWANIEAFQGQADADNDHKLTVAELYEFLKQRMDTVSLQMGRNQAPVLFTAKPDTGMSPEMKAALRDLLARLRSGRIDDDFELKYHEVLDDTDDDLLVRLLHALGFMKESRLQQKAMAEFEEIRADYPDSVVANHALAWLNFRKKDYAQGLENLQDMVANIDDPEDSYADHLLEFTGCLSAFTDKTLEKDEAQRLRPTLKDIYGSVEKLGDTAQKAYLQRGFQPVVSKVAEYDKRIEENPGEARLQRINRNNLATHAEFDFTTVERHLADRISKE
jgi:hypothetical protein